MSQLWINLAACSRNDYAADVEMRWTRSAARHIATRSDRYPGATDIQEEWAQEAARDRRAFVVDPNPRSGADVVRIVGFSPAAGFVITVVTLRVDGELWGTSAWKTSGAERRHYWEAHGGQAN